MESHYETCKEWGVSVQVSAHLSRMDIDGKAEDCIPRILVTEHDGARFKDREVADGCSYPAAGECIRYGILTAREYIGGRM